MEKQKKSKNQKGTQADERTSGRADGRTSGRADERTDERQILKKNLATEISPPRAHTQLRIARTKRKRKSFPVGTTPQPPIYVSLIFYCF